MRYKQEDKISCPNNNNSYLITGATSFAKENTEKEINHDLLRSSINPLPQSNNIQQLENRHDEEKVKFSHIPNEYRIIESPFEPDGENSFEPQSKVNFEGKKL